MTLPGVLVQYIEAQSGSRIRNSSPVGGGCISNTARLEFGSGERAFLKWTTAGEQPHALLAEEARSLRAIGSTQTVRVPEVLNGGEAGGFGWLLLEWLEPGSTTAASQAALGRQLAALHHQQSDGYGWPDDNFIGSLPQSNREHRRWPEFWRAERLVPQITLARKNLTASDTRRLEAVCAACDELLAGTDADGASLLHGDLWGGNLHTLADGTPALIDPSSYYGHREVDLAMARLFGGFSDAFFHAYEEAWPCAAGVERRVHLYQLYYLLVHINLFGGSYRARTMGAVAQLGY